MTPALLALTDQAEASLREMLGGYPSYLTELQQSTAATQAAALVAVDVLATLSELCDQSVPNRLDAVTSRLLAWQRITG